MPKTKAPSTTNLILLTHNETLMKRLRQAYDKHNLQGIRDFLLQYLPSPFIIHTEVSLLFDVADTILMISEEAAEGTTVSFLHDLTDSLKAMQTDFYNKKNQALANYRSAYRLKPDFYSWSKAQDLTEKQIKNACLYLDIAQTYYSYTEGYQHWRNSEMNYLLYYIDEALNNKQHQIDQLFDVESTIRHNKLLKGTKAQ